MGALGAGAARAAAAGGASGGAAASGGFGEALMSLGGDLSKARDEADGFKKSVGRLTQAFGGVGDALKAAFPLYAIFGKQLEVMAGFVPNATKALIDFGKEISQFVRLASPATVQKFNLAVDDMMAVIGRGLTPILEVVTKVVRNAADSFGFLAEIGVRTARAMEPFAKAMETIYQWFGRVGSQFGRLMPAIETSFTVLGDTLGAFMEALEPLGDLLIDLVGDLLTSAIGSHGPFETMLAYLTGFIRAMADLTKWLADATRELLALVGVNLSSESGTRTGSSVGAAVRPASVGSIDSVLQKAMTSAFSLGTAASSPEARTASAVEELKRKANDIYLEIQNLPENIAKAIRNGATAAASTAADVGQAAASGAAPLVTLAIRAAESFTGRNFGFGAN